MRNLLALAAFGLLIFLGMGWYLGWYQIHTAPASGGTVEIDVGTDDTICTDKQVQRRGSGCHATIVPSGTRSSCYRGPLATDFPLHSKDWAGRNFPNPDSFGICLTDDIHPGLWTASSPGREQLLCARGAGWTA